MEISFIRVNGLKVRVGYEERAGDEPPLLICNGLGQAIGTIQPLIEEIPGRTIITYDAPGVGGSEVPWIPRTIREQARIARGVLDHFGVEQADVMGISWGGTVAQQFAHSFGTRCRKLILAITSAGGVATIPGNPVVMMEIMMPWRYFLKSWGKIIGPMMYGGEALHNPARMFRHSARNMKPRLYGYLCQIAATCGWTSIFWLNRIEQETMVISGSQDPLIPPLNQKLLASLIPGAIFKSYDCGHLVMITRREEIGVDVAAFLDDTVAADTAGARAA